MAEAFARQFAPDLWDVSSGGLTPLGYVASLTKETIERNNYSAEGLSSKPILNSHWQAVDLVINMSGFEKHRVFEDPEKVEDWAVEDPFGAEPAAYQATFDDIRNRIEDLAARLRAANGATTPATQPQSSEKT